MKISIAVITVCVVIVSPHTCSTQEQMGNSPRIDSAAVVTPNSPEWTTKEYLESSRRQDFARCAELMDPADLHLLTEVFMGLLKADTTGELMESVIGPKGGVDAFMAIEPRERFALVFGSLIGKTRLGSVFSSMENHTLGHVIESDTLAHVVSRVSFSVNDQAVTMCIMTNLRFVQGRWLVMLDDDKRMQIQAGLGKRSGK